MMVQRRDNIFKLATSFVAITAAIAGSFVPFVKEHPDPQIILIFIALVSSALGAAASLYFLQQIRLKRESRRIFIIYNRKDIDAARMISSWLEDAGFMPWLDVDKLLPGQRWKDEIADALTNSGAAIVIVSENLDAGGYVKEELDAAIRSLTSEDKRTTPIIPVRIDSTIPPKQIIDIQWVDMKDNDAKDKLLSGLEMATYGAKPSPFKLT